MKIAIGADHGGFRLKEALKAYLKKEGHNVQDFGTFTAEPCDYPLIGCKVARAVSSRQFSRGILICKSGIGMSMVANKIRGVRAALCHTIEAARSSRQHNDANIIVFAGDLISIKKAGDILQVWLKERHLGGRHRRRVREISKIERLV